MHVTTEFRPPASFLKPNPKQKDRSRKLVGLQSPTACTTRAGGDSGPNFEN